MDRGRIISNITISEEEIIRIYGLRWDIECAWPSRYFDGITGYLVEPGDVVALAEYLKNDDLTINCYKKWEKRPGYIASKIIPRKKWQSDM